MNGTPIEDLDSTKFLKNSTETTDYKNLKALESLTEVHDSLSLINCSKLNALVGIEKFNSLKVLKISKAPCKDISPLGGLKTLKFLSLIKCKHIKNINPLKGLSELTDLCLDYCSKISDVSALGHLTKLETLSLIECDLIDNPLFLEQLINLKSLNLKNCLKINDFFFTRFLTKLEKLDLSDKWVEKTVDLQLLSTNLQELNLSGHHLTNLRSIKGLSLLKILSLNDCQNADLKLNCFKKLVNLEELRLKNCYLKGFQIESYSTTSEKANPLQIKAFNCVVTLKRLNLIDIRHLEDPYRNTRYRFALEANLKDRNEIKIID